MPAARSSSSHAAVTMDATTTAKRKRDRPRPASDAPATTTVDDISDADVEEFYAILRRRRDATRRLCSGAGAGARTPARAPAWRPSFSMEDFAGAQQQAPPKPLPNESVAENATPPCPGLDLNLEPPPDTPATPAPTTPA